MEDYDDYIKDQARIRQILQGKIAMGAGYDSDSDFDDEYYYLPRYRGGIGPSRKSKAAAKKSLWIKFVKEYAKKHRISYGDALTEAGPEYYAMTGGKKRSGSKTTKRRTSTKRSRKESAWDRCRETKKNLGLKNLSVKDIAKFYCALDKKCYATPAMKKRYCKKKKTTKR